MREPKISVDYVGMVVVTLHVRNDWPLMAPHIIQSVVVISCPTKYVLNARWSSRASRALKTSG